MLDIVNEYDFACFLAPPIDAVTSRGKEHAAVRDNVVLEYGLFLGQLGPNRVFLIHPRDEETTLPSDLEGVNHPDYKSVDKDNSAETVLAPVAKLIEDSFDEFGLPRRED